MLPSKDMYIVDTKMVIRNHRRKRRTGATMAEINMTKGHTMIYKALSRNIKIETHESQYYLKYRKRAKGKRMIDEKIPEN
jgi:hypothetical protein